MLYYLFYKQLRQSCICLCSRAEGLIGDKKRKRSTSKANEGERTKKARRNTNIKANVKKKSKNVDKGKQIAEDSDGSVGRSTKRKKLGVDKQTLNMTTKNNAVKKQHCTLPAFLRFIYTTSAEIPEESWALLKNTCFWDFIEVFKDKVLKEKEVLRYAMDFENIMKYYETDGVFNFGGTTLKLTPKHVSDLFSLPLSGKKFLPGEVKETKEKARLQTVFRLGEADVVGPSKKQLFDKMEDELKKSEKDHRLIASIVLMYMFSSVFFPRTSSNITWDVVLLALDLDNINRYNWPKSIFRFLVKGLNAHSKTKYSYIAGCTILVQYFFIEETNYRSLKNDANLFSRPRFCRIDTTFMFDKKELCANPSLLVVISFSMTIPCVLYCELISGQSHVMDVFLQDIVNNRGRETSCDAGLDFSALGVIF